MWMMVGAARHPHAEEGGVSLVDEAVGAVDKQLGAAVELLPWRMTGKYLNLEHLFFIITRG